MKTKTQQILDIIEEKQNEIKGNEYKSAIVLYLGKLRNRKRR